MLTPSRLPYWPLAVSFMARRLLPFPGLIPLFHADVHYEADIEISTLRGLDDSELRDLDACAGWGAEPGS